MTNICSDSSNIWSTRCDHTIFKSRLNSLLLFRCIYWLKSVWLDLTIFRRFGKMLIVLGNYLRAYLVFEKNLYLIWSIFYAVGHIFSVTNSLILTNNLPIRSHWLLCKKLSSFLLTSDIDTSRNWFGVKNVKKFPTKIVRNPSTTT